MVVCDPLLQWLERRVSEGSVRWRSHLTSLGHEMPCFRLLWRWWGARARRGRGTKEPRACSFGLQILEGVLRAAGSFMVDAELAVLLQSRMLEDWAL
jgi:hypothetical protein